jgi:hypothetical protein
MSDINSRSEEGPAPGAADRALQSRRAFVQRAALIGLPVVLATIPSRTVWAKPKKPAGQIGTLDASSTGSINPSSSASQPQSLL